jgi:hypothetical protein
MKAVHSSIYRSVDIAEMVTDGWPVIQAEPNERAESSTQIALRNNHGFPNEPPLPKVEGASLAQDFGGLLAREEYETEASPVTGSKGTL